MILHLPDWSLGVSPRKLLVIGVGIFLLALCIHPSAAEKKTQAEQGKAFGQMAEVRQILETRCLSCHGGKATRNGLDLTTRERLLRGGKSGPAVVPGKARDSRLFRRITHVDKPGMPFRRERLAKAQVALLEAWI